MKQYRALIAYETITDTEHFGDADNFIKDEADNAEYGQWFESFETVGWNVLYPAARNRARSFKGFRWGGYHGQEGNKNEGAPLLEFEIYGGRPVVLNAPVLDNPVAARGKVSLAWSAAADAASYSVYRIGADGVWQRITSGLTDCAYADASAAFDDSTYAYRVTAVMANGDEVPCAEKTVVCPAAAAGTAFWWNFLNVKCVAYPGVAGFGGVSQPHYMSRDRAGTVLVAPMSASADSAPAAVFDFAALVSENSLGELRAYDSGLTHYRQVEDFGDNNGLAAWKGAAVSDALIVLGNGGFSSSSKLAVIDRQTGERRTFALQNENGATIHTYTFDGGYDFDSTGAFLYANCKTEKNKIVKWEVKANGGVFKKNAEYIASDFTRIRNFTVYTVDGTDYAFFGEGDDNVVKTTGKLGALNLTDGTFKTLVTDNAHLAGTAEKMAVVNVKLADAGAGERYLVAQLDSGKVVIYAFNAVNGTAAFHKEISAERMRTLYGTGTTDQYRNFEMTDDGRYALVMNNAGNDTHIAVIGALEQLVAGDTPTVTAANGWENSWNVTLTVESNPDAKADGVRVFRQQDGKAGCLAVADLGLGETTWTDADAVPGVVYFYSVAYIRNVNGSVIVGPRSAGARGIRLVDLMTFKSRMATEHAPYFDDKNNPDSLFDNDPSIGYGGGATTEAKVGMTFTQPVALCAARALGGSQAPTVSLSVHGNDAENAWTGATQLGSLAASMVTGEWTAFDLNGNAAQGWTLVYIQAGTAIGVHAREIELFGAAAAERTAELARPGEAARKDAPVNGAAARHVLSWTEATDADICGVVVYRARSAEGPFVEVGRVGRGQDGAGAFTDTGAADGVAYCYRLAYVNEFEGVRYVGDLGAMFTDAAANYTDAERAAAESSLVMPVTDFAARMNGTTLTLGWRTVNTVADGLRVERSVNGGAWTVIATPDGAATAVTDAGVSVGNRNRYRVWSLGEGGPVCSEMFAVTPLLEEESRTVLITHENGTTFDGVPFAKNEHQFRATVGAPDFARVGGFGLTICGAEGPFGKPRFKVELYDSAAYGRQVVISGDAPNGNPAFEQIKVPFAGAVKVRVQREDAVTFRVFAAGADGRWEEVQCVTLGGDIFAGGPVTVGAFAAPRDIAAPQVKLTDFKVTIGLGLILIVK